MTLRRDSKKTAATTRFWEASPKGGRRPLYIDPDDLWNDCVQYFEWVEANPLQEDKVYAYQGKVKHEPNAKMRAMSIGGLCIFLDIAHRTWIDWRQGRPEFSQVITRVEGIIYNQKFEGAAAELLNANIIARDLGLADKTELTGRNGGPLHAVTTSMSPAEAAAAYEATLRDDDA